MHDVKIHVMATPTAQCPGAQGGGPTTVLHGRRNRLLVRVVPWSSGRRGPAIPALICYVVIDDRGAQKGRVSWESRCRERWGSEMWL